MSRRKPTVPSIRAWVHHRTESKKCSPRRKHICTLRLLECAPILVTPRGHNAGPPDSVGTQLLSVPIMSMVLVDIIDKLSIASLARFFETTWFLWWFVAVTILARWCWNTYFKAGDVERAGAKGWRSLYQLALHESDSAKAAILIVEAEAAILQKLGLNCSMRTEAKERRSRMQ